MLTAVIPCKQCFQISNYRAYGSNNELIQLKSIQDKKNMAYCYFPMNQIPSHAKVQKAELILYPRNLLQYPCEEYRYRIFPVKEFVNPYFIVSSSKVEVESPYYYVYPKELPVLKFDITDLAGKWVEGIYDNCGLILELLLKDQMKELNGRSNEELAPFIKMSYFMGGELLPAYLEQPVRLNAKAEIKDDNHE